LRPDNCAQISSSKAMWELSFAQEHDRGSAENPISRSEMEAKF
jgi:hypothetical protein